MSAAGAGDAGPGAADVDAVLTVLARHARALADLGAVRLGAGGVSVEIGSPAVEPAVAARPATSSSSSSPSPLSVVPPVAAQDPPEAAAAAEPAGVEVRSGTVGVFYRAAEPGAAPFVAEGDTVTAGQQIGIVEAMKLMIPLESDRAGRVLEFLVEDGASVEHGQGVLRLEPGPGS